MALLFTDSFDFYATADLTKRWSSIVVNNGSVTINAAAGRRSSPGLRIVYTNDQAKYALKTVSASSPTAIIGVNITPTTPTTSFCPILSFANLGASTVWLRLNTDMTISVVRGTASSNTVLGTSSTSLVSGSPRYLEMKVLHSTTVGTVDLRINGASVLSLTGQNTNANTWNGITLGQLEGGFGGGLVLTLDYDDLYVLDGSGSAPWNDFLGDIRVDARRGTAAGATTGWTPSAGSNWSNVNDTTPNDDTSYNGATASGVTDTFTFEDAPVAGATIYGVQHNIYMKKMDGGVASVAPVIRHSGTDNVGSNINPGTSYTYGLVVNQTNPGTSAQWTEAGFNAAEFGYKRTV